MLFNRNFKLMLLVISTTLSLNSYSQKVKDYERLKFKPGICFDKNFIDIKSFEIGLNLIATHGRLENNVINYYGIEVAYNKITLVNSPSDGITLRLMYQYVKSPIGFNIQNSFLISNNSSFIRPEIGLNYFGIISLNYGYYFRLDSNQAYNSSLNHLSFKLSLNLSYGEYLNMLGKSSKKW